jgi:hypothetical protein
VALRLESQGSQQRSIELRFIPKLLIVGALALGASVAGPVAASQAAPAETIQAVTGIGTWSGGPFGTPTLALGASTDGTVTGGGFAITYPRDSAYPSGGTAVLGTVTCLNVVDGDTAYIAGLIKSSSGARAGVFPVGDYITMGVQANALNFNPGQTTSPGPDCGSVTPSLSLTSGHYFVH